MIRTCIPLRLLAADPFDSICRFAGAAPSPSPKIEMSSPGEMEPGIAEPEFTIAVIIGGTFADAVT